MFKSALPIVSMIIGIVFYQKSYMIRDYIAVLLIVMGLIIFMQSGASNGAFPEATGLGIVFVLLSLLGSAGIPLLQEFCMATHGSSTEEMLFYPFIGQERPLLYI